MWEFWGTINFHSIFFLLWKSMVPQSSLGKISFFVQQNKEMYTSLEQLEGE